MWSACRGRSTNAPRRCSQVRPLHSIPGIPPGYVFETAAIAYVGKRSFSVAREAQNDYGVGQPICLLQDGKVVNAVVQKQVFNGVTTTINVNVGVSTTLIAICLDTSKDFINGVDTYAIGLFHFNAPTLYDSSLGAHDVGTTGLTLNGAAPVQSTVNPRFGNSCYIFNGTQGYYGAAFPFGVCWGSGIWCVEGWFWDRPTGAVLHGAYSAGWGNWVGQLYFNGGAPAIYSYRSGAGDNLSAVSSLLLAQNAWNHVVWCRDINSLTRMYVNGLLGFSTSQTISQGGLYSLFGGASNSDGGWTSIIGSFSGQVDEMRFTHGACPYNGPFTPPTKPFGPDFR